MAAPLLTPELARQMIQTGQYEISRRQKEIDRGINAKVYELQIERLKSEVSMLENWLKTQR